MKQIVRIVSDDGTHMLIDWPDVSYIEFEKGEEHPAMMISFHLYSTPKRIDVYVNPDVFYSFRNWTESQQIYPPTPLRRSVFDAPEGIKVEFKD